MAGPGAVEERDHSMLVLPLHGIFIKHDGPRRETLGTPYHGVFIAAGQPFRFSFPGCIGDECLTLSLPAEEHCVARDFHAHALLPASVMLERALLWRRLASAHADALEVEESAVALRDSILRIGRKAPGRAPDRTAASPRGVRQVERVKEAIAVAPERKWTLSALADLAGASPHHLARLFRAQAGITIHRYLTHARLARALERVLGGENDLAAVALDSGFASHSHLTERFRTLFGRTPSEVRKILTAAERHRA